MEGKQLRRGQHCGPGHPAHLRRLGRTLIGYTDVGWVVKCDCAPWSRSVDTSDVESWGAVEPTRRTSPKQTDGLKFTAQDTKRKTLELYEGVDLATVTRTPPRAR